MPVAARPDRRHDDCMPATEKNRPRQKIAPAQLRAARALLDWSRDDLSLRCGATVRTLARIEGGEGSPRVSTLAAIHAALEAAGVDFIPDSGSGIGVLLRKGAT